jgi:hypothetical protein
MKEYIIHGGSWSGFVTGVCVAYRGYNGPGYRASPFGFRIIKYNNNE